MAVAVIMPRLGQSVESCVITQWHKKKGDSVKKGDILFTYETDKASFEEEAKEDGWLLDIFYHDGDEAPVLAVVAVIGQKGEATDEFKNVRPAAEERQTDPGPAQTQKSQPTEVQLIAATGEIKISPRAKKMAQKLGVYYMNIKGTGPEGRIIERDIEAAASTQPRMTATAQARAANENLQPGEASGLGGRVTDAGLYKAGESINWEDGESKALSNVRKLIAKAMHASLQNSAQLTHHMSADVSKLLEYRKTIKEQLDKGGKDNITINDMICFAVCKALQKHPDVNCHFLGNEIKVFSNVHLGFAVDTPRGLMVPTLRNAQQYSLSELSKQLKNLAEQCKKGSIDPNLITATSASFTVSNLGNYGVEFFTPVINLPQVGILGVNTIQPKLVDRGNGRIEIVPHIGLSLTYDHRALDGGPASLFLREIKEQIEKFTL